MTKENDLRDLPLLSRCTDSESNNIVLNSDQRSCPILYTYKEKQKFYNKDPFLSQLIMVIIRNSGSGKTKLLFKFLLEGY